MVGRVGAGGLPCDVVSGARLAVLMHRLMPTRTTRAVERQLNAHFDHRLYGLQPSHGYEGQKADFVIQHAELSRSLLFYECMYSIHQANLLNKLIC